MSRDRERDAEPAHSPVQRAATGAEVARGFCHRATAQGTRNEPALVVVYQIAQRARGEIVGDHRENPVGSCLSFAAGMCTARTATECAETRRA